MFENERFVRIIVQLSRISNSLERIANRLDSWDDFESPANYIIIKLINKWKGGKIYE